MKIKKIETVNAQGTAEIAASTTAENKAAGTKVKTAVKAGKRVYQCG